MSDIPNCPNCHGERELNGSGGYICFFCGLETHPTTRPSEEEKQRVRDGFKADARVFAQRKLNEYPAAKPLTKPDVEAGRTFYVRQVDKDGSVTRWHGPFSLHEACELAVHFNKIGHVGDVQETPEPVKKQIRGA